MRDIWVLAEIACINDGIVLIDCIELKLLEVFVHLPDGLRGFCVGVSSAGHDVAPAFLYGVDGVVPQGEIKLDESRSVRNVSTDIFADVCLVCSFIEFQSSI